MSSTLRTTLPASFYERDADGALVLEPAYSVLEEAPAGTEIFRFVGYTIAFSIDRESTQVELQIIEKGVSAPLRSAFL